MKNLKFICFFQLYTFLKLNLIKNNAKLREGKIKEMLKF